MLKKSSLGKKLKCKKDKLLKDEGLTFQIQKKFDK